MTESGDPKEVHTMPTPSAPPPPPSNSQNTTGIDAWISYASTQTEELRRIAAESTDRILISTRSYLQGLQSVSREYAQSSQDAFRVMQSEYGYYEDLFFGKVKEGLQIARENPGVSYSVMAGASLVLMKGPRRFLFRNTIGRFRSEESLISNSEKKVKELRQCIELLKNESKKLEERAKFAEDELIRGRNKLKQAGSQLRSLVGSIEKTENRAKGLMDSLSELPARDARVFRSQVSSMASSAKQERRELSKKLTKIANYGISV